MWLQIVEAKEAGAAGVLGVIASVSSAGAPVLSSFTAAIGLDAPVEVWAHIVRTRIQLPATVPLRSVTTLD